MNIYFNGNLINTQADTLSQVLIEQGFEMNSKVATAVNGQFVAKTNRNQHPINDGDQIEVVAPMQGG